MTLAQVVLPLLSVLVAEDVLDTPLELLSLLLERLGTCKEPIWLSPYPESEKLLCLLDVLELDTDGAWLLLVLP